MEYSKFANCIRKLKKLGISNDDLAKQICKLFLLSDEEEIDAEPSDKCISAKIKIFHNEHSDWSHDRCVAAAHGWCRKHNNKIHDVIPSVGIIGGRGATTKKVGTVGNISFGRLVKLVRQRASLKVGGMGLLPFKIELPMKNLNRLQTKLEKIMPLENEPEALTQEELARRKQYATLMKKKDSMMDDISDEEIIDIIKEYEEGINNMIQDLKNKGHNDDEIENNIFELLTLSDDNSINKCYYFDEDAEFIKPNSSLNNIYKAPIILAKEMVQRYRFRNDDGSIREEYHFKPYGELKAAIDGVDKVHMIVEHLDSWGDLDTVGYVKDLVADDNLRAIRGMGYFIRARCPEELQAILDKAEKIGVSIGFRAELGEGGVWNGKSYDYTQKNIILDHLAVTLKSIPRCPLPACGVNVEEFDSEEQTPQFTIIKKDNYYYDIEELISNTEETRIIDKNSELLDESDSMIDDSFPDPKSGKIAGEEPKVYEVFIGRLRKFIAGLNELEQKDFANKKIGEILHMTDESGPEEIPKSGDIMDKKEYQDTIAAKDAEIEKLHKNFTDLEKVLKDSIKKEIKSFTDKYSDEELDNACMDKLLIWKDAAIRFAPSQKEPETIPIAPKSEELKDEKEKKEREDPAKIFADTTKEFNMHEFVDID